MSGITSSQNQMVFAIKIKAYRTVIKEEESHHHKIATLINRTITWTAKLIIKLSMINRTNHMMRSG